MLVMYLILFWYSKLCVYLSHWCIIKQLIGCYMYNLIVYRLSKAKAGLGLHPSAVHKP